MAAMPGIRIWPMDLKTSRASSSVTKTNRSQERHAQIQESNQDA